MPHHPTVAGRQPATSPKRGRRALAAVPDPESTARASAQAEARARAILEDAEASTWSSATHALRATSIANHAARVSDGSAGGEQGEAIPRRGAKACGTRPGRRRRPDRDALEKRPYMACSGRVTPAGATGGCADSDASSPVLGGRYGPPRGAANTGTERTMSLRRLGRAWEVRWREEGRHRSRRFDRKGDAQAWDDEVRRRKQLGPLALQQLTTVGPTLGQWIAERWAPEHGVTLEQSTRERYANVYKCHVAEWLDEVPISEITVARLRTWQAERLAAGVKAGTIQKARTLLSSVLRHATEAEAVPGNPMTLVRPPKVAQRDAGADRVSLPTSDHGNSQG